MSREKLRAFQVNSAFRYLYPINVSRGVANLTTGHRTGSLWGVFQMMFQKVTSSNEDIIQTSLQQS